MNLKLVHYCMLVLTALAVVSQALSPYLPQYATAEHAVGAVATALLGVLAMVSPSASGSPPSLIGDIGTIGTVVVPANDVPVPPASPPAAARMAMALACLVGVLVVLPGCAAMQTLFGSKVPGDVADVYSCVTSEIDGGDTKLIDIESKCLGTEAQMVIDIVDTLMHSPSFAASHPGAVGALRPQVSARRAAQASQSDAGAP